MQTRRSAAPLAIALLMAYVPATFAQDFNAVTNAGAVCAIPTNITTGSHVLTPPNNGSGFKFKSDGTVRTLAFSMSISGRTVNDFVSVTNATATLTGGPGCKLDVVNPVTLYFTPVAGEPGVLQATGNLNVAVGQTALNGTARGVTYTCQLAATFNPPTTITDVAPGCGTVTQTQYGIGLSFPYYRQ